MTLYSCVLAWPHHIFFHQMHENAIRTISLPHQFTHILPWEVQFITTQRYYLLITTFRCLLCRHNWQSIRQADINPLPLLVVVTVECCYSSCSSVIVDQQLKLKKNKTKQNYTWEMQKAVLHQVSLTFAARCTQLRCLMRKVVLCN